jgi:hypothetical protein
MMRIHAVRCLPPSSGCLSLYQGKHNAFLFAHVACPHTKYNGIRFKTEFDQDPLLRGAIKLKTWFDALVSYTTVKRASRHAVTHCGQAKQKLDLDTLN